MPRNPDGVAAEMKRTSQIILIVAFLAFSWLAMQAVHELGHVAAAWLSGGEVVNVVLHPCVISRTELGRNPHPLAVVWAGPVVGAMLPLAALVIARACRMPGVWLLRFFVGFCLIANGAYIAAGGSEGAVDSAVMMRFGSPYWMLLVFGLLTAPLGLWLWHRQGSHFGLGEARGKVDGRATLVAVLLLTLTVAIELIAGGK